MRRMATFVELEDPCPRQALPDRAQLVERAMLVLASLHGQDRALDTCDLRFDVPCAKARVEPDVVPSPEGRVDVGMVLRQPLAQVRLEIGGPHGLDARYADRLDEYVRRQLDEACNVAWSGRGMEQGDRAAVAVAEEPGGRRGSIDADGFEKCGQDFVGLPVQVIDVPALTLRPRRRRSIAGPRVGESAHVRRFAKRVRKAL